MLWNKTITLYNCYECEYEDPKTKEKSMQTKWTYCTIDGCFVKRVIKEMLNGSVKSSKYEYIIRIPEQSNYISPEEWNSTPNVQNDCFTLKSGDLIIIGSAGKDFKDYLIDEYVKGQRSTDIAKKHSDIGSLFIEEIHINTDFPYQPHYFIRG